MIMMLQMDVRSPRTGNTYPYTGLTKWRGPKKVVALTR